MLPTLRSTASTVLHALMFGLCGILGLRALSSFYASLLNVYITLFTVYTFTFIIIITLFTRIYRQRTSQHASFRSYMMTDRVWFFWVFMTLLWLFLLSVFIIYPALMSGIYQFTQSAIWSMSFPQMPTYMRIVDAGLIFFAIFFFGSFIYYPFTFYLLGARTMSLCQYNDVKNIYRFIIFTGMSFMPIVLHHIVVSMFTWLID